jgi:hypothetical protein
MSSALQDIILGVEFLSKNAFSRPRKILIVGLDFRNKEE